MTKSVKTPWLTLAIIAINLGMAFGVLFVPQLQTVATFEPGNPKILAAVLCLIAHDNLLHLLANMVFLAAVGPLIEFAKGPLKFATIVLIGGLVGVLAHFIFARLTPPGAPLLGASGAIAASVGYCAIRFARTKVPVAPNIGFPVFVIALAWLLIQVAGSFITLGTPSGGTAYWAHIGGFLAGLVFSVAFGGLREARHEYGHDVLERMNTRGPAAVLAAANALLKEQPKNRTAQWERIEALQELDHIPECQRAAIDFLADANPTEAAKAVTLLHQTKGINQIAEVARLKLADRLQAHNGDLANVIRRSVAESNNSPQAAQALIDLIEHTNGPERQRAIDQLQSNHPDDEATRTARQRGLIP
jgi:membrane associated rhomboid family serine protease